MITKYKNKEIDTELIYRDDEPNLVCLNDECDALEVERDEDDGSVWLVHRIAFDGQLVKARGPSYSCGGEPAYFRRDYCPVCGMSDLEAL